MGFPATTLLRLLPLAATGLLLAQIGPTLQAADTPTATAQPAKTQKFVTYACGTAQWLNAPHTVEMSDGVTFGQDDATLTTDAAVAVLDKDQNLLSAQARGPVHISDSQDDLTGQHGSIDFTHHLAKLQDSIVLVVKPGKRETDADKSSLRKQFKDPATLICEAMTYDYRRKIGRVPGPLTVRQVIQDKDGQMTRTLTADAGLYNGKTQTIQLVGDIHGEYSDGSKIVADTRPSGKPVEIGIKEGAEYIRIPFSTKGIIATKPDTGSDSSQDNADDADLTTVPTPPPSTNKTAPDAPADEKQAAPTTAGTP